MNLCNDGHDEVCFEGRQCPACDMKDLVEEKVDEIARMEKTIGELEEEIQELKQD